MQVVIGSMTAAVHAEFHPFIFVLRMYILKTGFENWKLRYLSASSLSYNDAQTSDKHLLFKLMYICPYV